ncbi:hypothetical protein HK405_004802 [Cladochytrium tenue]|nr:hypothetical protein HK405_004802 [Cladochytrium tenue]
MDYNHLYGSASAEPAPFDRKRRERSPSSSPDGRRKRRRSPSPRKPDGDHYVPNYERDGYAPAPRRAPGNPIPLPNIGQFGNAGFDMVSFGQSRRGPEKNVETDPLALDYFVQFRQFAELKRAAQRNSGIRADLDEDELRKQYQTYKENYNSKTLTAFFEEHKASEWFREKYHPVESQSLRSEINSRKIEAYPAFLAELNEGRFDTICFDESAKLPDASLPAPPEQPAPSSVEDAKTKLDGQAQEGNPKGTLPPPISVHGLFIRSVPPTTKRQQILEVCKSFDGFTHLALSDPRPDKKFYRIGWLAFNPDVVLEKAQAELDGKKIDDFILSLTPHMHQSQRTRIIPAEFNVESRLEVDLANARRLAKALDIESGLDKMEGSGCDAVEARLSDVIFMSEMFNEEPALDEEELRDGDDGEGKRESSSSTKHEVVLKKLKKRLDLHIEYLRRVHWYDYYSGIEAASPEDFARRTWIYLRRQIPPGGIPPENNPNKYAKSDFQRMSERLDTRIFMRTLILTDSWGGEELERMGGKNPETYLNKQLTAKCIAKVDTEKFRCTDCSKLFRGEEFVLKHIKGKHPRLAEEISEETEFFNAYVRDPNRVHHTYLQPPTLMAPGGAAMFGDNAAAAGMMMGFPMMAAAAAAAAASAGGGGGGVGGGPMAPMLGGMPMGNPMVLGMGMGGGGHAGAPPMGPWSAAMMSSIMQGGAGGMMAAGGRDRGGGGGRGGGPNRFLPGRLGPRPRPEREAPLPVDPRARVQRSYDDLDVAPKGDLNELNYD